MKVEDFMIERTVSSSKLRTFIQHMFDNYVYPVQNVLNSKTQWLEGLVNEKIINLFEKYRHNYFKNFVVELKQSTNDNIMIKYVDTYGILIKNGGLYFVSAYADLLNEYDTLKTKLTTSHTTKILVSENITTNELSGENENIETTATTLNTEKINQGTPIDTNIYSVGNTVSAEKGENTNSGNTTTTHTNSENATNTTISNFNVNYLLTLDNYNALIELDTRLKEIVEDMINKFFYKPFKEFFVNAIDFERVERIRGY